MIRFPLQNFTPHYLPPDPPTDWFGHLPFLHDFVAAVRPALFVNAGANFGDAYFTACQTVAEQGIGCACYGTVRKFWHVAGLQSYNEIHYKSFSRLLDEAANPLSNFSDASVDVLLIHNETHSVRISPESWMPKLRPGGFLLLAQTAERDSETDAWRVWEHLRATHAESFTFHHSGGLGVLRKPGGSSLESLFISSLFGSSPEEQEYIRRHYVVYSGYIEHVLRTQCTTKAFETKVDELTTELKAAQHERMILETELKQAQFERNEAQRSVEETQRSLAALQRDAGAARTHMQAEIERLKQALDTERQANHAIIGSLSWKITAPVRSFMEQVRKLRET